MGSHQSTLCEDRGAPSPCFGLNMAMAYNKDVLVKLGEDVLQIILDNVTNGTIDAQKNV